MVSGGHIPSALLKPRLQRWKVYGLVHLFAILQCKPMCSTVVCVMYCCLWYAYVCRWQHGRKRYPSHAGTSHQMGSRLLRISGSPIKKARHLFANQVQEPYTEEHLTRFMMRHRRGIKGSREPFRVEHMGRIRICNIVSPKFLHYDLVHMPKPSALVKSFSPIMSHISIGVLLRVWGPARLCDRVQEGLQRLLAHHAAWLIGSKGIQWPYI